MKKLTYSLIVICCFILIFMGCNKSSQMLNANKELINRFVEAINAGNWKAFDELLTDDFVRHCQATPDVQVKSREEFVDLQESFMISMPDQKIEVEMMIAEGDMVAVYATYSGTLTGPMGEFPATGRSMQSKFITFFRIENNRITDIWVEWDNLSMLTQLGLFPPAD